MKSKLLQLTTIAVVSFVSHASAGTFMFTPIEFGHGGINSPLLDPLAIGMEIREHDGGVDIMISNTSDLDHTDVTDSKPVVTTIYFEDTTTGNILSGGGHFVHTTSVDTPNVSIITAGGQGLDYSDSTPGGNMPGGNNIGFESDFTFDPVRPVAQKGIDPGETASFRFEGVNGGSAAVVDALREGKIRVGIHVQQIGPRASFSAGYANLIPEPSTALLLSMGTILALVNRRRHLDC